MCYNYKNVVSYLTNNIFIDCIIILKFKQLYNICIIFVISNKYYKNNKIKNFILTTLYFFLINFTDLKVHLTASPHHFCNCSSHSIPQVGKSSVQGKQGQPSQFRMVASMKMVSVNSCLYFSKLVIGLFTAQSSYILLVILNSCVVSQTSPAETE